VRGAQALAHLGVLATRRACGGGEQLVEATRPRRGADGAHLRGQRRDAGVRGGEARLVHGHRVLEEGARELARLRHPAVVQDLVRSPPARKEGLQGGKAFLGEERGILSRRAVPWRAVGQVHGPRRRRGHAASAGT
jgi:hypothetical protein